MYDSGKVLLGIIIFLVMVTFPLYYNIGRADIKPEPNLNTPAIQKMVRKQCIEKTAFMRANHMKLLQGWMNGFLKDGTMEYKAQNGKTYETSFDTCMECHASRKSFCDTCHSYAGVQPYCWKCHSLDDEG